MHQLAKPIRDRIEDMYVAANLSGIHHGFGYEKPWMVNVGEVDSIVFANGRIAFKPDELQIGIRVPTEFEFKFEVMLGSLVNLTGVEQNRAMNGDGLIYILQIDYATPNIVDVIAQIASAAIM